jgi:UDP-N-acetylmuramate--alanine ligase
MTAKINIGLICSMTLDQIKKPFFMGIAGSGMSALAQYLNGIGKQVSGSDRFFAEGIGTEIRQKLGEEGIHCFVQDGSGIGEGTDLIVASTAVEETVPEMQKARQMGIPVMRRSELLSLIASSKKTIAIGGTSGKSTTTAMLFDIMEHAGMDPSIISGAGLISLIRQGKIGNAKVGKGEWLVIEADESDGSIVQYRPEIGVLLNVDKDHQELDELMRLFTTFRDNSKRFIVNLSHSQAASLSVDRAVDFSLDTLSRAGFIARDFRQEGLQIYFSINDQPFTMQLVGKHNMENALAATAVAVQAGATLQECATALSNYEGIYRRHQVLGNKDGIWLIDDYAHNPVKCAAAIEACQPVAPKVIAWFQPHGYKPTKFLREDFVNEIGRVLRPQDEIWMSEIFYAGGTATKDISSLDLVNDLKAMGRQAFFVADRKQFISEARPHFTGNMVLLLMAARDPSLEEFARSVWNEL